MEYYAHSLKGRPQEEWQKLDEHLRNVAKIASAFTASFGAQKWAKAAGMMHDIGK